MQKRSLKYLFILAIIAGGTMIFLYAQNGYIFRKPAAAAQEKEKDNQEQAGDDIGDPTGDDPWNEMNQLVAAYYNRQGASFKGTVKLIDDNGSKEKVIEEHPFEYAVLGDDFFYSLDKIEVVQKKNLVLVADHANRVISMSGLARPPQQQARQVFDISIFKKLMEERKAEAKVTRLGAEKILTIENIQDPQVQGYRIYYNPQTYQVSKMLIGMVRFSPLDEDAGGIEELPAVDEKPAQEEAAGEQAGEEAGIDTYTYYLEITYTTAGILNMQEGTFNPENKFIRVIDKKTALTEPFKSYQLIINGEGPENETPGNSEQQ